MARVTQRDHEAKRRSWCSSSPARPFPAWKISSTRHRDPATDEWGQGHRGRREAAVASVFTGGAVAADQQPVAAGPHFGRVDDGPVVAAGPLGACPCRQLLPGPLRTFSLRPAARQRSGPHVHERGMYSSRSNAACPDSPAASRPRPRPPPAPRPRRADAPARTRARHHARGRPPTWPGRAGAACRPDPLPRPTRRSTSSSCAAGPTTGPAPSPSPGAGAERVPRLEY